MTQQEYEQKRAECWEEFCKEHPLDATANGGVAFRYAFDRAFALGKQTEAISQEDVEKASMKYRDAHYDKFYESLHDDSRTWDALEHVIIASFICGAQFALGKQEKDADAVISGWVAIDEAFNQCFLHSEKPIQKAQPIADTGDYDTVWDSNGKTYLIDAGLFPDMDSDSEPQEVEIILKRKKK